MKYDFTTIMNREGKDAIAVDVVPIPGAEIKDGFSKIPMWIADMNFATVPTIQEAVVERMAHPAYGYFMPSKEYYDSCAFFLSLLVLIEVCRFLIKLLISVTFVIRFSSVFNILFF